jgi:hypothetical protein
MFNIPCLYRLCVKHSGFEHHLLFGLSIDVYSNSPHLHKSPKIYPIFTRPGLVDLGCLPPLVLFVPNFRRDNIIPLLISSHKKSSSIDEL